MEGVVVPETGEEEEVKDEVEPELTRTRTASIATEKEVKETGRASGTERRGGVRSRR